jgi:hypothetical protein
VELVGRDLQVDLHRRGERLDEDGGEGPRTAGDVQFDRSARGDVGVERVVPRLGRHVCRTHHAVLAVDGRQIGRRSLRRRDRPQAVGDEPTPAPGERPPHPGHLLGERPGLLVEAAGSELRRGRVQFGVVSAEFPLTDRLERRFGDGREPIVGVDRDSLQFEAEVEASLEPPLGERFAERLRLRLHPPLELLVGLLPPRPPDEVPSVHRSI